MDDLIRKLIKGKVSQKHVENMLGRSLYEGISKYQLEFSVSGTINPEDLLIDGLGSGIIFNNKFQEFLVSQVLSRHQISDLCKQLNVEFLDSFSDRENILNKPFRRVGGELITLLQLDPSLYNPADENVRHEDETVLITPDPEKFLSLHDYQKTIKDEITTELLRSSNSRMLVHMPTGSGKTKTAVESITDFIRVKIPDEGLVVWFAHSNELCEQAYQSLVEVWRLKGDYPLPVFKLFGDNALDETFLSAERGVIFLGFQKFQSIQKSRVKGQLALKRKIASQAKLVIIDEAHKTLAKTYEDAINFVSRMPDCRVVGLTATPGRSANLGDPNNQVLAQFFNDCVISIRDSKGERLDRPLEYLQDQRVLAKLEHNPIEVKIDDFTEQQIQLIVRNHELDKNDIERLAISPFRNHIIITEIEGALNNPERDLILVFACSTQHCVLLKKLLEIKKIQSEIVLAATPKSRRDKYISDFKAGRLRVLINFGVLTTGFDAPKLKTLIIARHTDSMILYSQMIGRALRGPRNGGNEKNYVVDLVDNISNLGSPGFLFSYWEDFWGKNFESKNE
jgi:DNA repair protein RadD